MKTTYLAATLSISSLLIGGCATSQPKFRFLSYEEATTFERSLLTRPVEAPTRDEKLYVQPVNQKEPCKLPTSSDQLARSNFKAYWDGQCKNGFAYGFGRDIAISDTHHVEEISTYKENGDNNGSAIIYIDYVNNYINYTFKEDPFPKRYVYEEKITSDKGSYFFSNAIVVIKEDGSFVRSDWSPISYMKFFYSDQRNIVYKISDNSSNPAARQNDVVFAFETIEPATARVGGVSLVRFASGSQLFLKVEGNSKEPVRVDDAYRNRAEQKISEIMDTLRTAQPRIDAAKTAEREYLFKACNGSYRIAGLDDKIATKICNWRKPFEEAYKNERMKFEKATSEAKKRSEDVEQERQARAEISRQQEKVATQQFLGELSSTLNQVGQQMQNSARQNSFAMPAPQVFQPINQNRNSINCINTGFVINCR